MRNRIFSSIFTVAMVVFLLCMAMTVIVVNKNLSNQQMAELKNEATFLAVAAESKGEDIIEQVGAVSATRITLISADGTVVYDSVAQLNEVDNHANREEVIAARNYGSGESVRLSGTLGERAAYYAVRLKNGHIIRVSTRQEIIYMLISRLFTPVVFILTIAILFSVFLASRMAKKIMAPLNTIDFENPEERGVYVELKPFVNRINSQNRQIQRQMEALKAENRKQEKLRREFTANVSHELKTPLTTISGYAEIIKNGIAKPEDIGHFSEYIFEEAKRMIVLVDDILQLSQLDDNGAKFVREKIDLHEVCEGIFARLEPTATTRGISLILEASATDTNIYGSPKIVDEIVYNLCENAIKYNVDDGSVNVDISKSGSNIILKVSDTGIGIPKDELERVFERFYRVDKSHSKKVGGTGLGLSIVKHGAAQSHARVLLESDLGKGTTITVIFTDVPNLSQDEGERI